MLLRQFISQSNAIEEIYIVKTENDSDVEENDGLSLAPSTSKVTATAEKVLFTPPAPAPTPVLPTTSTVPALPEVKKEELPIKEEDATTQGGAGFYSDDDDVDFFDNPAFDLKETKLDPKLLRNKPQNRLLEDKNEENDDEEDGEEEDSNEEEYKPPEHKTRKRAAKNKAKTSKEDYKSSTSDDDEDEKKADGEPKCFICLTVLVDHDKLKKHLKTHQDQLPFKCEKCVASEVKNLYALNKHYEMHDDSRPYKCGYCEARFPSRVHRTAHQRRYHRTELENDTVRNANRRFVCRYCNKRFAAKFNLERHERNHEVKITTDEAFLNRRNKCYICNTLCGSKDELNTHLCIHADVLPYTCDKCETPVVITSARLLSKHLALHDEERPIKCIYCERRFISIVTCQAHERTHAQEKEADEQAVARLESEKFSTKIIIVDGVKRYECAHCGNSYSLLSTLRRHENIHTGNKQYICKACGKIFSKSSCLLQHERTHSVNTPYKCEICGRGFKETIRLIEHRRIHTGEKPFECNICFKRFRIKPLLKEHKQQCAAPDIIKTCKCRYCDSIFSKHRDVMEHIIKDHPPMIAETQCNFCDVRFKDAVALADHENNHTNPNTIECKECGRIFKQHSNLRRHLRLHTEDAVPFTCDLCGKSFSQAGAMKVHRRIHTGEKPYTCDLCNKCFYHSSTMNRHKRSHYKTNSKLFLFGQSGAGATAGSNFEESNGNTMDSISNCSNVESSPVYSSMEVKPVVPPQAHHNQNHHQQQQHQQHQLQHVPTQHMNQSPHLIINPHINLIESKQGILSPQQHSHLNLTSPHSHMSLSMNSPHLSSVSVSPHHLNLSMDNKGMQQQHQHSHH